MSCHLQVKRYADAMFLRTVPCPISAFLLDKHAWAAARFQDAVGKESTLPLRMSHSPSHSPFFLQRTAHKQHRSGCVGVLKHNQQQI